MGLVGLGCLTRFERGCGGKRFARCANAHLSDDETVAKMGHPVLDVGHHPPPKLMQRLDLGRRSARPNSLGAESRLLL